MNEPSNHDEIRELRNDIRNLDRWFVRIDEKLNGIDRIEKRAEDAYDLADKADDKAALAAKTAEINARDISALETRFKWLVGIIAPFIVFLLSKIFV